MALNKVSSSIQFIRNSQGIPKRIASSGTSWAPNTDVYTTDGGLVIKVELAGMKGEDLALTVEGCQLRIRGQRPDGCRAPRCRFLVMEINYGSFETVIELPEAYDLGQAKACYQNGFLRVDVPLRQAGSGSCHVIAVQGE
jgi:HSP20 family protein